MRDRLLFQLYLAWGTSQGLIFLSPCPSFDRTHLFGKGYETFALLTPPLPLGAAAHLLTLLKQKLHKKLHPRPEVLRNLCRRSLRQLGFSDGAGDCSFGLPTFQNYPQLVEEEMRDVELLLAGRLLSLREIMRIVGSAGDGILLSIQYLCLEGRVALLPALYPLQGSLIRCQRCGWEGIPKPIPCERCGSKDCCRCPDCGIMGSLSYCDPLYTASSEDGGSKAPAKGLLNMLRMAVGSSEEQSQISCSPLVFGDVPDPPSLPSRRKAAGKTASFRRYQLDGITLTPPQDAAARNLLEFRDEGKPGGTCLVWAACGAGKTEVSFPIIAETLRRGLKVLFASPRRDVVQEIAPRMASTFGKDKIVALYGGSGGLGREVPLVVATTHQVLRFYRKFDLVILDEGDAFPYPENRMLHFGVKKARKFDGKLVYLTATPAPWMYAQVRASRVGVIKIPCRYHGFPLPEPRFLKVKSFKPAGQGVVLDQKVLSITADLLSKPGARIFIFVPSVALTSLVGDALRKAAGRDPLEHLKPQDVDWSHASDRERDRKRERFFAGEFRVLVTTTIMERGVTVPGVHVVVLEAGQEGVFDAPTLVQIAGRCGRSSAYPTGEVRFISPSISRSMREAVAQIMGLNREALRRGYLREDWEDALKDIVRDWEVGRCGL